MAVGDQYPILIEVNTSIVIEYDELHPNLYNFDNQPIFEPFQMLSFSPARFNTELYTITHPLEISNQLITRTGGDQEIKELRTLLCID